jgi:ATP-dependent Clp protease ATP-binding subunit ClpA
MSDKENLASLLSAFMKRKNIGAQALATQVNQRFACACSISDNTITNWKDDINKTTKSWQQLLAIAIVLELSREETEELLQAAKKCPDLAELERRNLTEAERELLKKIPRLRGEQQQVIAHKNTPPSPPMRPAQVFYLSQEKISDFTGRKAELAQMEALLLASQEQRIVGLIGTGGMGKTSLAYHFARTNRDYFPDGVIGLPIHLDSAENIARSFAKKSKSYNRS